MYEGVEKPFSQNTDEEKQRQGDGENIRLLISLSHCLFLSERWAFFNGLLAVKRYKGKNLGGFKNILD
jgi:hypothetical protein